MLLILLESLAYAQEGEAQVGFTLAEIWEHSGFIARSVIIMLVVMMLGTVAVFIERLLAFRRAKMQSVRLASEIVEPLQRFDVDKALSIASDEQFKLGYLTPLLQAGLVELQETRGSNGLHNASQAITKAHTQELAKLQRGMPILATVGSTAPFVGLFGTTFGVINAFQGMAEAGSGLSSISAGISEALITTGVGIGVAVLGVWAFNYFNSRIAKVSDELDSAEADFVLWANKLVQRAG
ncbi:MAG: MotA/TolQ/ExbB proton channel family protein [Myxococcota bacterium]